MIKNKLLNLFLLTILFFACSPSQKITTSWVNPDRPQKKYTSVFVAALIQNNPLKYALEADLGAAAKARGFNVVKGYEIFPPNFNKENMRDRDLALKLIRDRGCKGGLAINPATSLDPLKYVMDKLDMILLMSVNPGFGGQKFISGVIPKIRAVKEMAASKQREIDISVDGGINAETAKWCIEAGANVIVAGSAIFNEKDRAQAIKKLRGQ